MHEFGFLKDLVVILSVAIVVVIVFNRFKLPSIAGFILSGLLVGPQGFGLINDPHQVEILAEIGVALLLFGIGLELALKKLKKLWKLALIGGLFQVGVTAAITYFAGRIFDQPNNGAIVIGFIIALSSTAIVLKGLQQRGEVDAPHGRLILGILVFQDFSVVPIMLLIPLLVGTGVSSGEFIITVLKSLGIVVAVLLLAILVTPRILKAVAKTKQRQLFILAVFVICLGTAWMVTQSGASLAIGAFLAGLVVAGSEYRHQAMADMISFREVFASLFFVSIGMMLYPSAIAANIVPILTILVAILLGKSIIVYLTALIMRLPFRAAVIAGLALAQVGEFSFVLLYAIRGTGLIDPAIENIIVSAAILSMFITPFVMSFGPKLAVGLGKFRRLKPTIEVATAEDVADEVCKLCDHIIIAGYGFAGRELALALNANKIQYVVVDINIENVEEAAAENQTAVFGDITSEEVLKQLGIDTAGELVILINDPSAAELAIQTARRLSRKIYIIARTTYLLDIDTLIKAGADEVIPAEREAAVRVTTQTLKRYKIDTDQIKALTTEIRDHTEDE